MNAIISSEQIQTMSSREIADLCSARHNDVITTIERLFEKGLLRESRKTLREYISPNGGRPTMVYDLTKNDSLKVVSGYSDEVRSALIDRWAELEKNLLKPTLPTDYLSALKALVESEEAKQLAQEQLAIAAPKAEALDRIANCENNLGIRESAKVLKINQKTLVQYLMDHKVVYRDQFKKIQGYQKSVDQKLIQVTVSGPRETENGEKVFSQVKLTPKLITRIATWIENGMPPKAIKK